MVGCDPFEFFPDLPGSDAARAKGKRFINTGRTGQTLAHISPALDARFNEAFAPVLARCGYPAG